MDKLNLLSLHVPAIYGERELPGEAQALAPVTEFPAYWQKGAAAPQSTQTEAVSSQVPPSDASSQTCDSQTVARQVPAVCASETQMTRPGAEVPQVAARPSASESLASPSCAASAASRAVDSLAPTEKNAMDPGTERQEAEPEDAPRSSEAVKADLDSSVTLPPVVPEEKVDVSPDAASLLMLCSVPGTNPRDDSLPSSAGTQSVHVDGAVTPTTRFSTEQGEEGTTSAGISNCSSCPPTVSSLLAACLPRDASVELSALPAVSPDQAPLLSSILAGSEEGFLSEEAVAALAGDASSLVSDPVAGHALTSLALLRGVKDSLSPAAAEAAASAQRELQRLLELQQEQQRQRRLLAGVVKGEESNVENAFLGALEDAMRQEVESAATSPTLTDTKPAPAFDRSGRDESSSGAARNGRGARGTGAGSGEELLEDDPALVASLRELLETLPRKKDGDARMLLLGEKPFVRPYARQIVEMWKIHLGETGRTTLKKEISERTQADATLKRRVLCIAKLKMATLEELVQIAEITGLLERTLQIANKYEAERQAAPVSRQNVSRRALSLVCSRANAAPPHPASQNFGMQGRRDSPSVPSVGLSSPLIFDPSLLACSSLTAGVSSCFSTSASSRRSPSPAPAASATGAAPPGGAELEESEENNELARLLTSASVNLSDPTAAGARLRWPKGEGLLGAPALASQQLKNAAGGGAGDSSSSGLSASSALFDLGDSELSAADATAAAAGLLSIITQQQVRSRPTSDCSPMDPSAVATGAVGPSSTEELLLAAFGGDEAAAAVVAALASGGAAEAQLQDTTSQETVATSARKPSRKRSRKRKVSVAAGSGLQASVDGDAASFSESSSVSSKQRALMGSDGELVGLGEGLKQRLDEAEGATGLGTERGPTGLMTQCQALEDHGERDTEVETGTGATNSPLLTLLEKSLAGCRKQGRSGSDASGLSHAALADAKEEDTKPGKADESLLSGIDGGILSSPDLFSACVKTTSEAAEFMLEEEDSAACERRVKARVVGADPSLPQTGDARGSSPHAAEQQDARDVFPAQTPAASAPENGSRSFLPSTTRDSDADSRSTTSSRSFGVSGACAVLEARCRGGETANEERQCSLSAALASLQASVRGRGAGASQECPSGEAACIGGDSAHSQSESVSREATSESDIRAAVGNALRRVAEATELGSDEAVRDPFAEACAREAHDLLDRATRANLALGITPGSGDEDASKGGSRVCRKRSRQDGDLDLRTTLQILSTVCVMYLKENLRYVGSEPEHLT
ncbi:conserved hypothetical protein [Neospora caninum Liverpool]|uniref:Uncharacterized protein n=1 Tax=Neospora caninum (strain Liverpool) TaxID=572307 RepID=F0VLF9_NEOCL|nr:conserved hypothetical protein [Neospora caninum Liverpool]CBZ54087.1 conserved hypothetical protein [Neospora caninum Liverpool]CEL68785.1 TPA: hypothetical protein BN1204_045200 [Neospora caninum Liverpool]|eukprot:XP_003884118.1 conserved hypothetical protein [Neospora caninum Liverpool]